MIKGNANEINCWLNFITIMIRSVHKDNACGITFFIIYYYTFFWCLFCKYQNQQSIAQQQWLCRLSLNLFMRVEGFSFIFKLFSCSWQFINPVFSSTDNINHTVKCPWGIIRPTHAGMFLYVYFNTKHGRSSPHCAQIRENHHLVAMFTTRLCCLWPFFMWVLWEP